MGLARSIRAKPRLLGKMRRRLRVAAGVSDSGYRSLLRKNFDLDDHFDRTFLFMVMKGNLQTGKKELTAPPPQSLCKRGSQSVLPN
jgi:hypothetical protein